MKSVERTVSAYNEKDIELISAIADKTRLHILFNLGKKSMCVNEITALFQISRPAVSHHLKVLKNNGLVSSEKIGQEIYYTQSKQNIVQILRSLADDLEECCKN